MLKRFVIGAGMAFVGAAFAVIPALAYTGTAGTSASTGSSTVAPGGNTTFTAHFTGGSGQAVTYSATGGGSGCTVTFNPTSGTTDASGNVTTTVTFGSGCSGTIALGAVSGAQNVSTTITVSGLPAASTQVPVSYPGLWLALLALGIGLVGVSLFGVRRKMATA